MNRIKLGALLLSGTLALSGCSSEVGASENKKIGMPITTEETTIDTTEEIREEVITETEFSSGTEYPAELTTIEEKRSLSDVLIEKYLVVLQTSNVHTEPSIDSNVTFIIDEGTNVIDYYYDNGFYLINYNGQIGYIKDTLVNEESIITFPYEFKKIMYCFHDTFIKNYDDTIVDIPALECVEVYEVYEDHTMLARIGSYVGIMNDDYCFDLPNTFVVVDISDQQLNLYQDNKLLLTTPVVTGTPTESRHSDEGLFTVYDISHNRYLVGPNYKTYVDYMIKYNGGEGLHDAEYHTNDDGFSHGWRDYSEFGGDTYLTNGSHGCINMPHEAAEYTYDVIVDAVNNNNEEVKVLVKK